MANLFLDANIFIDLVEKRTTLTFADFLGHDLYVSPLSVHLISYVYKYKMPHEGMQNSINHDFQLVPFTQELTLQALRGPTPDFEDNLQLHSAAHSGCDIFLTSDQTLLKMTFFGTMRVSQNLNEL